MVLLEAALREKEREIELLQQVSPGSSRETQLLRRQIVENESQISQKELHCRQLEEVRPVGCVHHGCRQLEEVRPVGCVHHSCRQLEEVRPVGCVHHSCIAQSSVLRIHFFVIV